MEIAITVLAIFGSILCLVWTINIITAWVFLYRAAQLFKQSFEELVSNPEFLKLFDAGKGT